MPMDRLSATPSPTILVVDDDLDVRSLLQRALKDAGYSVLAATSGRAAIREAKGVAVDLVLADVHMYPGEGIEMILHLWTRDPGLPIIAMSAGYCRTGKSTAAEMRSLGVHRTLEKPFTLEALLEVVRENVIRRG